MINITIKRNIIELSNVRILNHIFTKKSLTMIDTHTHIYLPEFDKDRDSIIQNAKNNGVKYLYLPNIDSSSIEPMIEVCNKNPNYCFPMIGLHPGSVKENYLQELEIVEQWFSKEKFCAIGEIGLDLYWDKTFIEEQKIVFIRQMELALQHNLPVVIHVRNAFDDVFKTLDSMQKIPQGIFHCFSGNIEQAKKVISMGFMLGIGGVVTFNNSGLQKIVQTIGLDHIVLETDAPYLAPTPYRGKRNEPSYLKFITAKIAELTNTSIDDVIQITTTNALKIFKNN